MLPLRVLGASLLERLFHPEAITQHPQHWPLPHPSSPGLNVVEVQFKKEMFHSVYTRHPHLAPVSPSQETGWLAHLTASPYIQSLDAVHRKADPTQLQERIVLNPNPGGYIPLVGNGLVVSHLGGKKTEERTKERGDFWKHALALERPCCA